MSYALGERELTLGVWSKETVRGHICDVFEPQSRNPFGYGLIYLHGVHLQRLLDKPAFVAEFENFGLPVICPRTGRSWWTNRICPDFDPKIDAESYVVKEVIPFFESRFGIVPPRIGILGTSMGGQGALRLAYRRPDLFKVVAAISPAIDFHKRIAEGDETLLAMFEDEESARQETAILHIHPLNWPKHQFFCCDPADERWWDSVDRLRMKLFSIGVPFEYDLTTTGGGHGFEYYNLMAPKAVKFVYDRLQRERASLL